MDSQTNKPLPSLLTIFDDNGGVLWKGTVSTPLFGIRPEDHIWLKKGAARVWYRVIEARHGIDAGESIVLSEFLVAESNEPKKREQVERGLALVKYEISRNYRVSLSNPGYGAPNWVTGVKDADGVFTKLTLEYGRSPKQYLYIPDADELDRADFGAFFLIANREDRTLSNSKKYDGQIGVSVVFDIPQFHVHVDIKVMSCKVAYNSGSRSDQVSLDLLIVVSTSQGGQLLEK